MPDDDRMYRWWITGGTALAIGLTQTPALAAPWVEDPALFSENAGTPASKVDAADLDGDGFIDLVFANGSGLDKGDEQSVAPQQVFLNDGGTAMVDVSAAVFGGPEFAGRAVKPRDVEGDGDIDILLGTTWQTRSQLLLNDGSGAFVNVSEANLPQAEASVGDFELGDVDAHGARIGARSARGEDALAIARRHAEYVSASAEAKLVLRKLRAATKSGD